MAFLVTPITFYGPPMSACRLVMITFPTVIAPIFTLTTVNTTYLLGFPAVPTFGVSWYLPVVVGTPQGVIVLVLLTVVVRVRARRVCGAIVHSLVGTRVRCMAPGKPVGRMAPPFVRGMFCWVRVGGTTFKMDGGRS